MSRGQDWLDINGVAHYMLSSTRGAYLRIIDITFKGTSWFWRTNPFRFLQ